MNTDNLATQVVGDDLGFEGMRTGPGGAALSKTTFLFAAVEVSLVVLAQLQHVLSRTARLEQNGTYRASWSKRHLSGQTACSPTGPDRCYSF